MTPWELTGKVGREKRDQHGVRKLPVPGAGWALWKVRESSGWGGSTDRQRNREVHTGREHTEPETPD